MSRQAAFFWVCFVTAMLCLVGLTVLSNPTLTLAGMPPFDLRWQGYSADAARAYLDLIVQQPEARALYLGQMRQLDTVFPILLASSIFGAIWLNSARFQNQWRIAMAMVPCAYLIADLSENALIAKMLRQGGEAGDSVIGWASFATQTKWGLVLAMVLLAGWAWRGASTAASKAA